MTRLRELLEREQHDLMQDGGDYGYGGEWFPHKEANLDAIEAVVERWVTEITSPLFEIEPMTKLFALREDVRMAVLRDLLATEEHQHDPGSYGAMASAELAGDQIDEALIAFANTYIEVRRKEADSL